MNLAGGDYVQFMDGNGLDSSMMSTKGIVCGMDSNRGKFPIKLLDIMSLFCTAALESPNTSSKSLVVSS